MKCHEGEVEPQHFWHNCTCGSQNLEVQQFQSFAALGIGRRMVSQSYHGTVDNRYPMKDVVGRDSYSRRTVNMTGNV